MIRHGLIIAALAILIMGCAGSKTDISKAKNEVRDDLSKNAPNQRSSKELVKKSNISDNESSQTAAVGVKDEGQQIVELIDNYEVKLVEAINSNDFSIVEPYLLEGSPLYKGQKKLVRDLFKKGVKEKHISHDYGYTYIISEDSREVEVIERIKIMYPNKKVNIKDFQWIYSVKIENQSIKLSNIRRWLKFDEDIEILEESVKTDGYYIDETLDEYDIALIAKLNDKNSEDLDRLLDNNQVKVEQLKLVRKMRQIGHSFKLLNSEIIESTNIEEGVNPYKVKKKLTINYIDKGFKKKQKTLYTNMILEERRTGYRGLFGGYAAITSIKDINLK